MFQIGKHTIKNPVMLAPMAGVSEMPYRVICLEMGAGLATTELISAKGLFYKNRRTRQYLTYDREKESPYSVQLFGGDVEAMADAARQAMELGADIVDINMGCPVKKVTKTGSGSSLLCNPKRAAELVEAMRKAVNDAIPITAKIRTGWDADSINCLEMTRVLEDAGCAALGVHGRTRAQAYRGEADWSWITKMKSVAVDMPILGNGDVLNAHDAKRMMDETGCDGVLVGRGALGNPWLFKSCLSESFGYEPTMDDRREMLRRHFAAHMEFHRTIDEGREVKLRHNLTWEGLAIRTFRQHLIWYSRGLPGGSHFRKRVVVVDDRSELEEMIEAFFDYIHDKGGKLERSAEFEGINYKQAFG